ncbi:MAG: hypothetical protein HWN65_14375 [Candidatus Helarchaeota archaeon]|nr:hypothetical protein [Candidatus Helarchaeota archaeon]
MDVPPLKISFQIIAMDCHAFHRCDGMNTLDLTDRSIKKISLHHQSCRDSSRISFVSSRELSRKRRARRN